jgi:hypothetical protein
MRTFVLTVLVFGTISTAVAGPCSAGTGVWNEQNYGGDAGGGIASADVTAGQGALDTICGKIGNATGGADLDEIYINGSNFSATTSGRGANPENNPALYLFNLSGDAVAGENDISGVNTQAMLSGLTLTPGIYYIALVPNGQDPWKSGQTPLFDSGFNTSTGTQYPVITNKPLVKWSGTGDGESGGEYRISLTNAAFAVQTPEPAAFGLLGAGLCALVALRKLR